MVVIVTGPAWALPMGMAFAAGWLPCIGPVLATILSAASLGGDVAWGGTLLGSYSLGLGVPFVLLALGLAGRSDRWGGFADTDATSNTPAGPCSWVSACCS